MGLFSGASSFKQDFGGKVIIITGGTSGIGKELALQLAGYGAKLYICARDAAKGKDFVAQLAEQGGEAHFDVVDVQDAEAVERYVASVVERAGRIDYLYHCAGIILGGEIRDHQLHEFRSVLETNVFGTAYMTFYVYKQMAKQRSGHIVNFGSAAGLFPLPLMSYYSASKFFVLGLTESLRQEATGLGVRVGTVAPGIVDTPIYETGLYSQTDKMRVINLFKKPAYSIKPDKAARKVLLGTVRHKAIIFTQTYPHMYWLVYRLAPWLYRWLNSRAMRPYRKRLRKP